MLINAGAALFAIPHLSHPPYDWAVWEQVPGRIAAGTLYQHDPHYTWAWSPLAAWVITFVVLPLGYWFWVALHFIALAVLRDWRLILLTGLSFPFWLDTFFGNMFTFVAISGFAAMRGSRLGGVAYLALFVLMPRPIQLPIAVWLLWRHRTLRVPVVAISVIGVITTLASGYAGDWLAVLVSLGAEYPTQVFNLSPTRYLGPVWLVAGVVLAGWLTMKGWVGIAGMTMTPYLLPQYLLMAVVEFRGIRHSHCHGSSPRDDRDQP
jgi:hypothetical protein